MESVLRNAQDPSPSNKASEYVQGGRRGRRRYCQRRVVERETGMIGERAGLSVRPCSVAVELDVFRSDELW